MARFFDVGAHTGSVIGGVMSASRASQIIAVEVRPAKVADLRRRFLSVNIIRSPDGKVAFTVGTDASGYSSLDPAVRKRAKSFQIIIIQMGRMYDSMPYEDIDTIKIEIEVAEFAALRGADKVVAG